MNILCHPEIWEKFINIKDSITKSENDLLLYNIFNNPNNLFIYKGKWKNVYIKYFNNVKSKKYDFLDLFYHYIDLLNIDNRIIEDETELDLVTYDDFVLYPTKSNIVNFVILNNYTSNSKSVILFEEIVKPNQHWLYFNLLNNNCLNNSILLYGCDFSSNEEIEKIINYIANIKNIGSGKIYIQSDYLNFGNIFNEIIGKKITYCTSRYKGYDIVKSPSELLIDLRKTKAYFGVNSSFKTTKDKDVLHPRTMICNNIVMIVTHDFPSVIYSNTNWHMTISLDKKLFEQIFLTTNDYDSINN